MRTWWLLPIFFGVLIFSAVGLGQETSAVDALNQKPVFNAVTTAPARTLPKWKVAFQRSPGANINTTLLANSLSLGVLPRLEVGTAPVFFLSPQHRYNFNFKVNFWKGDWIDWGYAYSETRFRMNLQTFYGEENPDLIMHTSSLLVNLHPDAWPFQASLFVANSCGYIDAKDAFVFIYTFQCREEAGIDVQIPVRDRSWLTLGHATLREAGLSPYESTALGWGAALSTYRPGEFFSRPSVGLYYVPATGSTMALLSTTFYER